MPSLPFEIYLKLDGIEGESTVKGHEKEIVVVSYEQGIDAPNVPPGGGGGGAGGKAVFSGVRFRKLLDKASIPIFLACASGKHIKNARFAFRRVATAVDFYNVTLDDVVVKHIVQRAATGAQYPLSFDTLTTGADDTGLLDEATLAYTKIRWEYHTVDASGAPSGVVKGGWDLKLNKPI